MPYLGAALAALAMAWSAPSKAQDAFKDVKPDHWAYDAVTDLQKKGILKGYPDGYFNGKRVLTRYEFAVALERALQSIPPPTGGPKGDTGPAGPAGPAGEPGTAGIAGPPGMTPEEVANLLRLTDQFKSELASLGMNISQINGRLDDLAKQVAAIRSTLDHMVKFNGDFFFMGQTTRSRNAFLDYSGAAHGPSTSLLGQASTPSDFHLMASANLSGGVKFVGDLVSSNYLSYRGGTLSAGAAALPNSSLSQVTTLYQAELILPIAAVNKSTQLEIGRYKQEVTPLTMYRPDFDVYADTPWYDDGNYVQDGFKFQSKFGSATTSLWAGATSSVVGNNLGTAINSPMVGAAYTIGGVNAAFKPAGQVRPGAIEANQNVGLHIAVPLMKYGELGVTAIDFSDNGAASSSEGGSPFSDVMVYGVNLKLNPIGRFMVSAEAAKSVTQASFTQGDGQNNDRNNAFLLNLGYNTGAATIQGGYQYYDPRFAAPGYWNKIGNWYDPTNVEGPFVRLGWKFSSLLQGYIGGDYLEGAHGSQDGDSFLTRGSNIYRGSAGIKYHLNKLVDLSASYEGVLYDLSGAAGTGGGVRTQPVEQYITFGAGLNLSGNTVLKLAYQIINYQNVGTGFAPNSVFAPAGTSNASVFTTQVAVHF
jgi:hypothetical protein